jgi:DNA-binding PadR family transcriptional regulator
MTDAELAILSLLAEGPSYDHDINDTIEARGLRRWTAIGNSSMYYVLDKLEKQGLVERISEQYGHRKFGISAAGSGVLQTAVSDLLTVSHAFDRSFELGLANLHLLKPSQVRSALLGRQQDLQAQLAKAREEFDKVDGSFQVSALFDHSVTMLEAELAWLNDFLPKWEAQAPEEPVVVMEPSITPRIKQVVMPQDPDSVHKHKTRVHSSSIETNVDLPTEPPANETPVSKKTVHDTLPGVKTIPPTDKPSKKQKSDLDS